MSLLSIMHLKNTDLNKSVLLYFVYSIFTVLFHLLITSVFTFFHFILEHDLGSIEIWLTRNGWEIICFTKFLSVLLIFSIIRFNSYTKISFWSYFKSMRYTPTKKMIGVVLFIMTIFYALIIQFGGGIQSNQLLQELLLSSFMGSIFFYGIDIIFIIFLLKRYEVSATKKFGFICMLLFMITSNIVLPYLSKYFVFLFIHFLTLYVIAYKENLGDIVVYLILVVSILSSLLGIDLIWDNSYSLFSYSQSLPVIGVLGIWCIALGYYHFSKLN